MPPGEMTPPEITKLLAGWGEGDTACLEQLAHAVQHELLRIASRHMRRERANHTLQTTALVNEAFLRLVESGHTQWRNRAHFFGVAAHVMRQILIDHARRAHRAKRGGKGLQITWNNDLIPSPEMPEVLLALDEALARLAEIDERKARTVELRFFGGLDVDGTAEVLHVSPNTVIRDWSLAKAWLRRELEHQGYKG